MLYEQMAIQRHGRNRNYEVVTWLGGITHLALMIQRLRNIRC